MGPSLPAGDRDVEGRARGLARARETWRFAWDWPVGVATAAELPKSADYSFEYVARSLETYLLIAANLGAMALEGLRTGEVEALVRQRFGVEAADVRRHLLATPKELAARVPDRRPERWTDFEALYAVWKAPPVVGFFHRSPRDLDRAFAWQRIAGVNPMVLARCARIPEHFPVTDAHFRRALPEDALDAALAEGRVFLADYAVLEGVETGVTDGVKKYLGAPLALFAVDRATRDLVPVAIQTGQTPGPAHPIWTPADGWRWWMARTAVQIADACAHEGLAHLGRTHLVMEAVLLAMHRELSERHPLHALLLPHVETTAAINHSAKTSLIAPGGTVDRCFAPTIEAFGALVKQGIASYRLDRTAPRDDLAARGLDDREVLPVHPYRDDALPLWDALAAFVAEYVALYYATDAEVAADPELQAFVRALGADDGGRLAGVPPARTRDELAFLLTRLVWIAGPQHSAVNFPQFPYMGFPPNLPGASYRPMPDASTPDAEAELVAMLPSWRIALEDTTMVYLLSHVRDSTFGHYSPLHFRDLRLAPILLRFREALAQVEAATVARDAGRLLPYPHLRPSQVLQSISI